MGFGAARVSRVGCGQDGKLIAPSVHFGMATTTETVTATTTALTPTDYVLVNTPELLSQALADLHVQPVDPPSLYVDLEGTDLCRHGRIALITIYISPLEKTYLIDVTALGEIAFTTPALDEGETTLKTLLEDEHTPKVLFDCRNDSDALYNLYKVDISGGPFFVTGV